MKETKLPEQPQIEIGEPTILKNRISFKLSYSKKIKKYFRSNIFYVEYNKNVRNTSPSILYIPVISNTIPIAWATGANIYVKEIDKTYLQSLDEIKLVMKKWYSKLPFSTTIHARNVVSNNSPKKNVGLLFSGGIDSLTSYVRHRLDKPFLIMIWGADVPTSEELFWKRIRRVYKKFAEEENVKINFIKSNLRQFINEKLLTIDFGKYSTDFDWWEGFHHGIGQIGLCAPLTMVENIGTLLIASSHSQGFKFSYGSHPWIDNKMAWVNTRVVHDGWDLTRQEKIRKILKGYLKNKKHYFPLRVCTDQFNDFNCSKCEKCMRTITGLVLENIDPNNFGFRIDDRFFTRVKNCLVESKERQSLGLGRIYQWRGIQKHIPKKLNHNLYNSKEFFKWFKNFEIPETPKSKGIQTYLLSFYYKLPENVRKIADNHHPKITKLLKHRRPK